MFQACVLPYPSGTMVIDQRRAALGDLLRGYREQRGLSQAELAQRAVEVITQAAKTGKIGDGKVFVSEVEQAIRIRTDERGAEAI